MEQQKCSQDAGERVSLLRWWGEEGDEDAAGKI